MVSISRQQSNIVVSCNVCMVLMMPKWERKGKMLKMVFQVLFVSRGTRTTRGEEEGGGEDGG